MADLEKKFWIQGILTSKAEIENAILNLQKHQGLEMCDMSGQIFRQTYRVLYGRPKSGGNDYLCDQQVKPCNSGNNNKQRNSGKSTNTSTSVTITVGKKITDGKRDYMFKDPTRVLLIFNKIKGGNAVPPFSPYIS